MAGLVPAIHVLHFVQDVDARHKAGHDDGEDGVRFYFPLGALTTRMMIQIGITIAAPSRK